MKRPVPTSVLIEASAHVRYEIEQFAGCTAILGRALLDEVPTYMATIAHNALLESFTVHFRGLYDFLYLEPKGDDMAAADWFPDGSWPQRCVGPSQDLRAARKRVNKDIAHLTYDRLKRDGQDVFWPHEAIVEELRGDLWRFVDGVDQERVPSGFNGGVWQSLPWPNTDGPLIRLDSTVVQPVATSGFGLPVAVPKNLSS
jgi:hypothetical protein